jgi:P-type Cu+ transporter
MKFVRRLLAAEDAVRDPVCGMTVPASRARDFVQYGGETHHFCSKMCREQFEKEPEQFVRRNPE